MPQEFYILQCFSCRIFQIQIVKQKPKWECKMCNEKQSVKQIFFKSTMAKECRLHVQQFNAKFIQQLDSISTTLYEDQSFAQNVDLTPNLDNCVIKQLDTQGSSSKWIKFVQNDESNEKTLSRVEKIMSPSQDILTNSYDLPEDCDDLKNTVFKKSTNFKEYEGKNLNCLKKPNPNTERLNFVEKDNQYLKEMDSSRPSGTNHEHSLNNDNFNSYEVYKSRFQNEGNIASNDNKKNVNIDTSSVRCSSVNKNSKWLKYIDEGEMSWNHLVMNKIDIENAESSKTCESTLQQNIPSSKSDDRNSKTNQSYYEIKNRFNTFATNSSLHVNNDVKNGSNENNFEDSSSEGILKLKCRRDKNTIGIQNQEQNNLFDNTECQHVDFSL